MAIAELRSKDKINRVPIKTRGIYALYQEGQMVKPTIWSTLAWHEEKSQVFEAD